MNQKYQLDQVSIRMVKEPPLLSKTPMDSPEAAVRVLADTFRDYDREIMGVVHLRTDNVPINMVIASMGSLNYSLAHPRELLKAAFLSNAASVMLFHNHPSGRLNPSKEDIALTAKMQKLCMLAGIPILDHIILGGNHQYFSFREKMILPLDEPVFSTNLEEIDLKVAEKEAEKYRYRKKSSSENKIHASLKEKKEKVAEQNTGRKNVNSKKMEQVQEVVL